MEVLIPSPLRSYTGAARVRVEGATLEEVLTALDRRYPGLKFRVVDEQGALRRHMRFFAGGEQVFDLAHPLTGVEELLIVQALSGG